MALLANSFNKEFNSIYFQNILNDIPWVTTITKSAIFVNADEIKLYQRSREFEF